VTAGGRLRILVSGMVAGVPGHGGATWAVLQYMLGLRALGHDVMLVEPVPGAHDAARDRYFDHVVDAFALRGRAALLSPSRETRGTPYAELRRFAGSADLLLNVAGMLEDEALVGQVPVRAYLDLDPAFTQLWAAAEGVDMRFEGHTHFVTVGLTVGDADGRVPTCGLRWMHTLPPVVLDEWPVAGRLRHDAFTTIANWRGYGSVHRDGVHYGQKAHSVRKLIDLPRRSGRRVLVALDIHPDEERDVRALAETGWQTTDPRRAAGTPAAYRRFVQGSLAELGVAKSGYVASACGWFSDRSACYLASGRPVVAQDTGFSRRLPVGAGLLAFGTIDEAAGAMDDVVSRYDIHRRAARELAEDLLAADVVLPRLLDRLGMETAG
jgi:hypothetical protein